jgi:hypothetical protein
LKEVSFTPSSRLYLRPFILLGMCLFNHKLEQNQHLGAFDKLL